MCKEKRDQTLSSNVFYQSAPCRHSGLDVSFVSCSFRGDNMRGMGTSGLADAHVFLTKQMPGEKIWHHFAYRGDIQDRTIEHKKACLLKACSFSMH